MPVQDLTGGGTRAIVAIVHISAQKPNAYFKLSIVKLNNSDSDTFIQNVSDQKNKFSKNVTPILRACQLTCLIPLK